jgi:hypothetical protein
MSIVTGSLFLQNFPFHGDMPGKHGVFPIFRENHKEGADGLSVNGSKKLSNDERWNTE